MLPHEATRVAAEPGASPRRHAYRITFCTCYPHSSDPSASDWPNSPMGTCDMAAGPIPVRTNPRPSKARTGLRGMRVLHLVM